LTSGLGGAAGFAEAAGTVRASLPGIDWRGSRTGSGKSSVVLAGLLAVNRTGNLLH
jgi:hypothetical protein